MLAKVIVVSVWALGISAWVVVLGFAIGFAVGLPGWSGALAWDAAGRIAGAAALTIVLQPVTGLFASVGRGYIAGLGWAVLTVAIAQVLAVLGLGALFPWAVPALVAGAAGPDAGAVPIGSIVLVVLAGLAGVVLTIAWWRRADHTG